MQNGAIMEASVRLSPHRLGDFRDMRIRAGDKTLLMHRHTRNLVRVCNRLDRAYQAISSVGSANRYPK